MTHAVAMRLGIVSALLFAAGSAVWALGWPVPGSDEATIAQFYASRQARIEWGGAVSVLALALIVPFAAAVALLIAQRNRILAITAVVGAGILTLAGASAETINLAGAVRGPNDPTLARILYEIPQVFGAYTSGIGLGLFAVAVALAGVLPREWSAITLIIGVAEMTPASLFVREFAGAGYIVVALIIALTIHTEDA